MVQHDSQGGVKLRCRRGIGWFGRGGAGSPAPQRPPANHPPSPAAACARRMRATRSSFFPLDGRAQALSRVWSWRSVQACSARRLNLASEGDGSPPTGVTVLGWKRGLPPAALEAEGPAPSAPSWARLAPRPGASGPSSSWRLPLSAAGGQGEHAHEEFGRPRTAPPCHREVTSAPCMAMPAAPFPSRAMGLPTHLLPSLPASSSPPPFDSAAPGPGCWWDPT